jgi:hypothetical protein
MFLQATHNFAVLCAGNVFTLNPNGLYCALQVRYESYQRLRNDFSVIFAAFDLLFEHYGIVKSI